MLGCPHGNGGHRLLVEPKGPNTNVGAGLWQSGVRACDDQLTRETVCETGSQRYCGWPAYSGTFCLWRTQPRRPDELWAQPEPRAELAGCTRGYQKLCGNHV